MSEYMRILKMIEDGEISPEQAAELLKNIGTQQSVQQTEELDALGILSKIDSGELSADQGISLLGNMQGSDTNDHDDFSEENPGSSPPFISEEEIERWKRWWAIPLYLGVGIVLLAAIWMNAAYQSAQFGFWFYCSWVPLLLGLTLMGLSWGSRSGPWIHVRVRGKKERVAVSIPAPLKITGWALRNFGQFIPHLEKTSIDEIIVALENTSKQDSPLYVQVDDGDSGEHVEVFIG